jgi:Ca2+-binding RTX toxin-like protein
MQGENSAIENRGLVDASRIGAAIQLDGTTLTNFGSGRIISDDIGLYLNGAHDGQLINRGFFKAPQLVQDDVSDFRIVNTGRMVGEANMGAGVDTVVNKGGSIVGDVLLGADNDLFVFTGGSVDGVVNGGEGHDIYRVLKGAVDIVEDALGGDDTIRAAVTFTLGENIEDLVLTGKRAINGTGNDLGNLMAGITTDNKLRGGAGDDILDGRKGNDILVGGQDADTFLFATGHGNDTIVDFQNGVDKIDLTAWDGIDSYIDMILGHLTVDGNDLVITNGDDTLRLRNVDVAELDSTDFAI